jgi:hypothetical protein
VASAVPSSGIGCSKKNSSAFAGVFCSIEADSSEMTLLFPLRHTEQRAERPAAVRLHCALLPGLVYCNLTTVMC